MPSPPPGSPLALALEAKRGKPSPPPDSPLAKALAAKAQSTAVTPVSASPDDVPRPMPRAAALPVQIPRDEPVEAEGASEPPAPPAGSPLDLALRRQNTESLTARSARRGVQEIASAPGTIAGMYGLAGAAIDTFVRGEPWGESMLSDEGKQIVAEAQAGDAEAQRIVKEHPEALLRTGLQSMREWYDWGGEVAGVTNNPDGSVPLDEEVGGVLLSTAMTLPVAVVSKPLGFINKIGNTVVRMGLKTALRGIELSTPMTILDPAATVTRKGAIIGANLAVGVAMNDATRAITEEPTLTGLLLGGEDEDSITSGSVTPVIGVPDGSAGEQEADTGGMAAVGAGAAGLAALGMALRPGGGARLVKALAPATASVRDFVRRAGHTITDDAGLLVDDVRTVAGKAEAEQYDTMLRATTRHANEATFQRYDNLGILGQDGDIRVAPGRVVNKAHADLTPQQQELFELGMQARHERAQRSLVKPQPTLPLTDTELKIRIDAATNDPKIKAVMDAYDESVRGFARWEHATGMITPQELARRSTRAFVPQVEAADIARGARKGIQRVRLWASRIQGKTPDTPAIAGPSGVRDPAKAMDAFNHYTRRKSAEINETQARRAYLNLIADAPDTAFPGGNRSVIRVRDKAHAKQLKGHSITVPENGKMQEYRLADPRTKRLLEFRPHAVAPTNDYMRRVFQKFTTGNFNPLFAPTALVYDATFGMLSADNNKLVTGLLDQGLAKVGAPVGVRQMLAGATRVPDAAMLIFEGLAEGAHGRYRQAVAERLAGNVQMLGGTVTPLAARKAADAFLKTKYGLMHMSGYASNSFASDIEKLGVVERALNKTGWVDLLDTVRDAYRMGLFARNVAAAKMLAPDGQVSRHTYDAITRHVREVASEPSRRGTSDFFNKTLSTLPYGGVMMHSISHLFAQFKNPAAYSTILSIMAAKWYAQASMSPEARDHVTNSQPDYARIANMYIELPHGDEPFNADDHIIMIPLGPELGGMTTIAASLFDGVFGDGDATSVDTPIGQQIKAAVGELFNYTLPIGWNVGTAALGYGQTQLESAMQGRELFRQPWDDNGTQQQRGVGLDQGMITDRVYNLLTAAFGSSGRTWAEAAEAMDSQVEKYDRSYFDGADKALDVVWHNYVEKNLARYNLFDQSKLAKPLGTHASSRAYEVDSALERMTQVIRALHPTLDEPLDADIPFSKLVTEMPAKLSNPVLKQQGVYVAEYFGSPMHSRQMDEISQLRKSYHRMQGNYDVPLAVRNHSLNRVNDMMMERYGIVLDEYGEFEQFMQQKFEDEDWTIDHFVNAVNDDLKRRHAN